MNTRNVCVILGCSTVGQQSMSESNDIIDQVANHEIVEHGYRHVTDQPVYLSIFRRFFPFKTLVGGQHYIDISTTFRFVHGVLAPPAGIPRMQTAARRNSIIGTSYYLSAAADTRAPARVPFDRGTFLLARIPHNRWSGIDVRLFARSFARRAAA